LLELVTASSNVLGVCRGYWMAIWGFPWCASTVGEFHGLLELVRVSSNASKVSELLGVFRGFCSYVQKLLEGSTDC